MLSDKKLYIYISKFVKCIGNLYTKTTPDNILWCCLSVAKVDNFPDSFCPSLDELVIFDKRLIELLLGIPEFDSGMGFTF